MRFAIATLAMALAAICSDRAYAYRPFDGTDAATTDPGTTEVELGPAGLRRDGPDRTLLAPSATINYGIAKDWEAVLEGTGETDLGSASRRSRLVDNRLLLKTILRHGTLQEETGPSIAAEFGALLPGIGGDSGTGGTIAMIVSQRWFWATIHLNVAGTVTREQHGGLFVGTIVEGPLDWTLRPVVEIFHERDYGSSKIVSGLVGLIWQVREGLVIDLGLRGGLAGEHTQNEIRMGVTFSLPSR